MADSLLSAIFFNAILNLELIIKEILAFIVIDVLKYNQ